MLGLFAAAIGMTVAILTDVIASRIRASRVTAYGSSLVTGLATALACVTVLAPTAIPTLAIATLTYGAWWFAFLNLVQALESSLRVRLLGEIRSAGGRIPLKSLVDRYNDDMLLRLRLERLCARGAVIKQDGRLLVASSGLRVIAGLFRFLKKRLLGQLSEFGAPTK